jgi:hypothetical protein
MKDSTDAKMIEVKIKFWTNNIAAEKGKVVAKNAWQSGVVAVRANKLHGIRSQKPLPFHSLAQLSYVIEKALTRSGIKLNMREEKEKLYKVVR